MQIDCYGFEATSQWFKRRTLDPYLIKRSEGITYLCSATNSTGPSTASTATRTVAFASLGHSDAGPTRNPSATSLSTKQWK